MAADKHVHTDYCRWCSLEQIAAHSGHSIRLVREWHGMRHANGFPSVRTGTRSYRVRPCEFDAWLIKRSQKLERGQAV